MLHISDSSKVFVNSKVIGRLDKIKSHLSRQSKQTSKIAEIANVSVASNTSAGIHEQFEEKNWSFKGVKDIICSMVSELMKESLKKLVSDFIEASPKQT